MKQLVIALAGAAMVVAALSGCSFEASVGKYVSKDELAKVAKVKMEEAVGQTAKSVVCDDDLEGKVGATQRCVLTANDGSRVGLTTTVTSVEGANVKFDVVADDKPME